uniref:Uncharacterized protein n=1 Tax=Anopheles coluzzii TaxID=1518534 RepID=A0A8W7P4M3_ANOCL
MSINEQQQSPQPQQQQQSPPTDYSFKSNKLVILKDLKAKLKGYLFSVCAGDIRPLIRHRAETGGSSNSFTSPTVMREKGMMD